MNQNMHLSRVFTFSFFTLCFFQFQLTYSQELLTLDGALQIALEKNYNLKIQNNAIEKSKVQHHVGNADMLPEVTLSGSWQENISNVSQEDFTGSTLDRNGAVNRNSGFDLEVRQTLFDGLAMFRIYDQLGERVYLQELGKQEEIENTMMQVITSYCDVVSVEQRLSLLQQNIDYSNEQFEVIKKRETAGRASMIDRLNMEVILVEDSSALLQAEMEQVEALNYLSLLLGGTALDNYKFDQNLLVDESKLNLSDTTSLESNILIKQANANMRITQLDYEIYKAAKLPQVFANVGYSYNRSAADFGFAQKTIRDGLNFGVTARWTLFQGFKRDIQMQATQIDQMNQELSKKQVKLQLNQDFNNAQMRFQKSKDILNLETRNLSVYQKQYEVSKQLYELGRQTSLELRETQKQLFTAQNKRFEALRTLKLQEAELLRLNGQLVNF